MTKQHTIDLLIHEKRALVLALQNAQAGLQLTYDALEKGFYDEAMLHVGHHEVMVAKALDKVGG